VTGMCSYVDLVGPWLVSRRDQVDTTKKTLPLRFAAATTELRPAPGFTGSASDSRTGVGATGGKGDSAA
jgi:hypothetical protein